MSTPYWPLDEYLRPLQGSTAERLDSTAAFTPDVGPAITRRRTTATFEMWTLSFSLRGLAAFTTFENWFDNDLANGALPYIWRHPLSQQVRRWKFAPPTFRHENIGADFVRVSFQAMQLPGTPVMAPYIMENSARIPDFVADYDADRYWIEGVEVAATALSGVSGDYVIATKVGPHTITQRFATYDGDVPQTAPSGVLWLAGFSV